MNLRPRRKSAPDLNITPLIDVVFLLLIFFMVSSTFVKETRIKVELPGASKEETVEEAIEQLDVTVDASGRFFVNQKEVLNTDVKTLKRAMEQAVEGNLDLPVVIAADAQAAHQAVIKVMDAAQQLGLLRVTFTAAHSPSPD